MMDGDGWSASDRSQLRRALLIGRPEGAAGSVTHRLGMAIARRDTDAVLALAHGAAAASPLARLRLARAVAAAGGEVTTDAGWSTIDRRRVDAAVALGRPSRTTGSGSTPFLFGQAIPIVEAKLAGKNGYFIVDTGAPHTALSRAWCERNGVVLARGVAHSVDDGAGREIAAVTTRIESIEAGGTAIDVPAILFEFPSGLDVAGIMSPLDAFQGVSVTLDYAAKRFIVGDDALALPGISLFWEGGVPLVHARIADDGAFLMLDSGAGGELLCEQYAHRFDTSALTDATSSSAAGALPVRLGLRLPLSIGGEDPDPCEFALKNCEVTGTDTDLIGSDGILGGGWMAGRRIGFDADRLTCRFTARNAP